MLPKKTKSIAIIVNWNRAEDTIECIRSIGHSEVQINVLVVDNGSHDGSADKIQSVFPQVTVHRLPSNSGFAGGYNAGVEKAMEMGAQRLFLLNNDTVLHPEAIGALLKNPWDVAVPKILYHDAPDTLWAAGCRWRPFPPAVVMRGFNRLDSGLYDRPQRLDYATGCALMAKRRVFEKAGGFDTLFENYMEDYDFCHRVISAGFSIGYEPDAMVFHKVSRTLGDNSHLKLFYIGRNSVLFFRKDHRFSNLVLALFLVWVGLRECAKGKPRILVPFYKGVASAIAKFPAE
jgi:GT2 family glycosyltransferase